MSFFGRFFGGKDGDDSAGVPSMPWDQRPSIFEHLRKHTSPDKHGLTEGGETLPDEARANVGSGLRWAAGAMDGVMGHHFEENDDNATVRKAVELIVDYCDRPIATTKAALYQHIVEGNTLPLIDPMIRTLLQTDRLNHDRLYELAYSFVTESPDREPVKFGIAILGLYRNPQNEQIFQTIGRHEEFTLYCAVAISNLSDDPDVSLWTLAKNVDGWGRIQVVERLAHTEKAEIKEWMLREGYRNSVMYEYLAYTCATAGELLSALSEDAIDRDLLTSAGEILASLIVGVVAGGIEDYEDGAIAIELYLGHLEPCAATLEDFWFAYQIKGFLDENYEDEEEENKWEVRAACGWATERRDELGQICDRILSRPDWFDLARLGLGSDDESHFHRANSVARVLGIETQDIHWRRLKEKPTDSGRWFHMMFSCDETSIADVIAFAERNIDLEKIATGPADESGLGPGWEHHQCLGFVLQDLRRFPGHGVRLIQAGLRSPVIGNRNMAVLAMSAWGHERWDDDLRHALESTAKIEPYEHLRESMDQVLRGETLEY